MLDLIRVILFMTFASSAFAVGPYVFECQSDEVTLRLQRRMQFAGVEGRDQTYFGQFDYTFNSKNQVYSGTLDTLIYWRQDLRPQYNEFFAFLMDKSEVARRKAHIEGGSLGFAEISLRRTPLTGKFKVQWKQRSYSEDLPDMNIKNQELNCQMRSI